MKNSPKADLQAVLFSALSATLSLTMSCSGSIGEAESARAAPDAQSLTVTDSKADYYRQAVPKAASFVGRRIPKSLIRSANKGNDVTVEARNEAGETIAYLRDFVGPVSMNESCPCDPLNLTLVFNAQKRFDSLLAPGPIYKWGKEPMSAEEIESLTEIIKNPEPALLKASSPDATVDATSGATKKEYAPFVVAKAALTTQRLAELAAHTEKLLTLAPQKRDQQRLLESFSEPDSDKTEQIKKLASFIGDSESESAREDAYRRLASSYVEIAEDSPDPQVESVLLNARVDRELRIAGCYLLAEKALRNDMTQDCVARTSTGSGKPLESRLAGTVAFNRKEYAEAVPSLEAASNVISHLVDPGLHYRLGEAARQSGDRGLACQTGKLLYRDAPLYPGVPKLLESCEYRSGVARLREEIEQVRRQRVLTGEHVNPAKVPTLNLEAENQSTIQTNLTDPERITVAVFFATWCAHCQRELPKIVDFRSTLNGDSKVRVVAVRTMIERDVEEFDAFKARFGLNFPVHTDPAMGSAFASFAQSQNLERPGVPTVAVIDSSGDVRYFLRSYEYSDTPKELAWILAELERVDN
ncbi:MAG: TlpA disulfide reductase family protein [Myxococcota bacterium]